MPSEQRIFWIGDSTVQTNRINTWPRCGMGQALELYLHPGVTVRNYALDGCSSRSFRDEGHWEPVRRSLGVGDILLIQFGHNDEEIDYPSRYTTPEQYADNLLAYAREAKQKGALPVLVTPLTRRRFENGELSVSHSAYPDACRALAAETSLPLIDLTATSRELVSSLGEEASWELYMYFDVGLYQNHPNGLKDNTHLRYAGAVAFCGLIADGLRNLGGIYAAVLLQK